MPIVTANVGCILEKKQTQKTHTAQHAHKTNSLIIDKLYILLIQIIPYLFLRQKQRTILLNPSL